MANAMSSASCRGALCHLYGSLLEEFNGDEIEAVFGHE